MAGLALSDIARGEGFRRSFADIGDAVTGARGQVTDLLEKLLGGYPEPISPRAKAERERLTGPINIDLDDPVMQTAMNFSPMGIESVVAKMLPMLGGVMTYHGTPHTWAPEPGFPKGRFRLDKIGTGEGAQVYGHGAYLPEAEAVGRQYADNVVAVDTAKAAKDNAELTRLWKIFNKESPGTERGRAAEAQYDALLSEKAYQAPGNIYPQDLPDEVLPKMLQWDKPLAEQPEYVRRMLKDFIDAQGPDLHASDLVRGGDVEEILRARGIPGLSYLDAGSRGSSYVAYQKALAAAGGDHAKAVKALQEAGAPPGMYPTRNHVVWDQELLDRMARAAAEMR